MEIVFTVCNRNSLAHAVVLARSVRKHHPDSVFWLGWVDSIVPPQTPEGIHVLSIADLRVPAWSQMSQTYYAFELVPACRPWFALEIIQSHPSCTRLTFLAPTVKLFAPVTAAIDPDALFNLTPNIDTPLPAGELLDDKRVLNIGMFHSGSWSLRPQDDTLDVLRWWAERTADRAKYNLCEGMATDQLWLNYIPVWINQSSRISHPGWHYGLHAILNKRLSNNGPDWEVDGSPLLSADFAGLSFFDPLWSDYAQLVSKNRHFKRLVAAYRRELREFEGILPAETHPGFGKEVHIPANRLTRKKLVRRLKSVIAFIDEF